MRTSCGPGSGSGISSSFICSGSHHSFTLQAFISIRLSLIVSLFEADASIDRDHDSIDIRAGSRSQVDGDPRHIGWRSYTLQRATGLYALFVIFKHPFGHLAFKWTGRDCVDSDVALAEL